MVIITYVLVASDTSPDKMTGTSGYEGFLQVCKVALGANCCGFLVTAFLETHKITDLVGTGTFSLAAIYGLYASKNTKQTQPTAKALTYCTVLWSLRLATFLFYRVCKVGHDNRLHFMFPNRSKGETWFSQPRKGGPPRISNLAMFWILQTAWCIAVVSPVTAAQFAGKPTPKLSILSMFI